jgi:hypothetical protein
MLIPGPVGVIPDWDLAANMIRVEVQVLYSSDSGPRTNRDS